jgi:pilus assembly protein CpaE
VNNPSKITVVIAESDHQFRDQIVRWLTAEPAIEVLEAVSDGDAAVGLARKFKPDVVLMDMHLPGRSGIEATERITTLLPNTGVIMISQDGAPDSLRKAMIAGARQFVLKTTTRQELLRTLREVHQTTVARRVLTGPAHGERAGAPVVNHPPESRREGQIIAVFSPKGGVGATTVAVNTALALRKEHRLRVTLVDASLPFGDIAVFLDLAPSRSIMDLVVSPEQIDLEYVEGALSTHQRTGTKVLLAPPRPEMAEMVTADQLRRTLAVLKENYDFTIVDTWSCLDERVLTILEVADRVLLCFTLDLPAIKSAKIFLEVSELLRFPAEKIVPVLIKSTGTQGIELRDVEGTIGRPVGAQISSDPRLTSRCINEGDPVVIGHANTPVALDLRKLAGDLAMGSSPQQVAEAPAKAKKAGRFGLFAKS